MHQEQRYNPSVDQLTGVVERTGRVVAKCPKACKTRCFLGHVVIITHTLNHCLVLFYEKHCEWA